ncbi:MAG: VanZ family protein [Proteobacteria bacterium]|nr:VanZ family protein [Pseudomonadota bacterium]
MKSILLYISKINNIDTILLKIFCFAVVIAIILAGLWPFNFFPKNKVKWLQNNNGVSFSGQGLIISHDRLQKSNESLFSDRAISVELWVKPLNEPGNLPPIFNLYDGKLPGVITVGQWRSHLIVRCRTNDPALFKRREPYRERGLNNALLKNRDVFITIVSDKKESAVYLNGMHAKSYSGFPMLSEYGDEPLCIIIGNSPTGHSFWKGEFMGLAIYNKSLAPEQISANYQSWIDGDYALLKQNAGLVCLYPFDERKESTIHNYADSGYPLIIPEIFKPVQRVFLEPVRSQDVWKFSYIKDVAINLIGFIPFGFFVSAFLAKKNKFGFNAICVVVVIAGFSLSMSIELIQAYLPTRFSQLSDLVLNTSGTTIGVFVLNLIQRLKK